MDFRRTRHTSGSLALAAALGLLLNTVGSPAAAHCGSCGTDVKHTSTSSEMDLVDTAVSAGDFNTLVTAVKAAGLVDALKGDGPFTVFAPSDAAFAKLPKGTVESLLKAENRDKLASILTYHVVAGNVGSDAAMNLDFASTLNGQRIDLKVKGGSLYVDGAKVVSADIQTSNGVIHVIDTVIMPAQENIIGTAVEAGSFNTLAAALKAAGLVDALSGKGPFTVFAPTDAAFAALPAGTVEELLKPENKKKLTSILTYHVVSGRVYSDQALSAKTAMTLQKSNVSIGVKKGTAMVNDAKLVKTDIETTNGVIHVIDKVLMPSENMSSMEPVQDIIRMAINRGAPLYNDGNPAACAAVYELTASSLLQFADMSEADAQVLRMALIEVRQTHSASTQAWILRHALDEVYESEGPMRSAMR